jgi:chemotaxis protein MotB
MMHHEQRRKKPQPGHADDWLMTYADVITLLLCFFVVFLIVSVSQKNAQQKVQAQQRLEEVKQAPSSVRLPEAEVSPAQPSEKMSAVFQGDLPFHGIEQSDRREEMEGEPSPARTDDLSPQISVAAIPAPLPEHAHNPQPYAAANFEQKGDRILTYEENNAAFFDSGSAVLSVAGMSILKGIAVNLKSDKFKNYQITVEGHTDDTPIQTAQFPSNWELSTARAAAVVRFFLSQDIQAQRLRAAGYADTFSKVPNRDAKGNSIPVNQALNRRVVIKLEKIEKSL